MYRKKVSITVKLNSSTDNYLTFHYAIGLT